MGGVEQCCFRASRQQGGGEKAAAEKKPESGRVYHFDSESMKKTRQGDCVFASMSAIVSHPGSVWVWRIEACINRMLRIFSEDHFCQAHQGYPERSVQFGHSSPGTAYWHRVHH